MENIRSTYSYKKPDSRQAVSDILITKQVRVISYPRSGKFPRLLFPLPPLSPLAASPLLPLLHVPSRPCLSSPNSQGQFTLSTFSPPSRLCHPSSFSHLHLSHVLFPRLRSSWPPLLMLVFSSSLLSHTFCPFYSRLSRVHLLPRRRTARSRPALRHGGVYPLLADARH